MKSLYDIRAFPFNCFDFMDGDETTEEDLDDPPEMTDCADEEREIDVTLTPIFDMLTAAEALRFLAA